MRTLTRCTAVLAAVALLGACGTTQLTPTQSHLKSETIDAALGGAIAVTHDENLELGGLTFTVPANALSASTTLTLTLGDRDVAGDGTSASAVAVWGPAGLRFTQPATMTLPLALSGVANDETLVVLVEEADGSVLEIDEVTLDAQGRAVFPVSGFSKFQAKKKKRCQANADCRMGESCVNGRCKAPAQGCQGPNAPSCAQGYHCEVGMNGPRCVANVGCVGGMCPPGWSCTVMGGNAACYPTGSCNAMQACPPNSVCQTGRCAVVCQVDADCPTREICQAGLCQVGGAQDAGPAPQCRTDADCPMGGACFNGQCRWTGSADAGTRPDGGVLPPRDGGPGPLQCQADADCGMGGRCANGLCSWSGGADAGVIVLDGGSYRCLSNADCGPMQQCVQNLCR